LEGVEQLRRPRVEVFAECPGLHPVPLDPGDRTGVADQLCGQLSGNCRREELCRLDLLRHDARLRLRTRSRRVIAREREEHYEPEKHGKSGSEYPEDASGAVAVVEVTAVG